jgi:hypothetical protein
MFDGMKILQQISHINEAFRDKNASLVIKSIAMREKKVWHEVPFNLKAINLINLIELSWFEQFPLILIIKLVLGKCAQRSCLHATCHRASS